MDTSNTIRPTTQTFRCKTPPQLFFACFLAFTGVRNMQRRIILRLRRTSSESITSQTNFLVFISTPMFILSPSHVGVRATSLIRRSPLTTLLATSFCTFLILSFVHSSTKKNKKKKRRRRRKPTRPHIFLCRKFPMSSPPRCPPFLPKQNPLLYLQTFFFHRLRLTNTYEPMQRPNTTWIPLLVSCICIFFTTTLPVFRAGAPPLLLHFTIDGEREHTHMDNTHTDWDLRAEWSFLPSSSSSFSSSSWRFSFFAGWTFSGHLCPLILFTLSIAGPL
ncbi:hypothetical protein QR685DRAFT_98444 [Neurospora intermedia]|uniref:Transmembrane protein n=1 Tax=Neurospora intermedia TaxID=5142 RepID=A0ABR3D2H5_NEUIN